MARYLFLTEDVTTILSGKSLTEAVEKLIVSHPEITTATAYRIAGGVRSIDILSVTEQKVVIK